MANWDISTASGKDILPLIEELARMRIVVFRDFPYIYDGSIEYEREYLQTYVDSPESILVVVKNESGEVVGCSTGLPLAHETIEFKKPFLDAGYDIENIFYFGESVLLSEYRGLGIGHRFFDEREAHARKLKRFNMTTFCAVNRPEDHPLRPQDYRPLDEFWIKRGYTRQKDLVSKFKWLDVDQKIETEKSLTFWTSALSD